MDRRIKDIRKLIVDMIYNAGEGHIPSSLSVVEILYVIYKNFISRNYDFHDINRNVFILSKGHASAALYAVLHHFGLLNEDLLTYCKSKSKLGGHPDRNKISIVEASTGSLGHGLPIALGIALAKKINGNSGTVFVLIGDGEINEGSIWESIMVGRNLSLNSIFLIVDNNRSQNYTTKFDYRNILESFGWVGDDIDGHNPDLIFQSINKLLIKSPDQPKFIIANTVKGKGISFIENNPAWHHRAPTKEEYQSMMEELS